MPITLATLVSHLSLYLVLLAVLRDVGVSDAEASWAQVLATFAVARLITIVPVTPGSLGTVELILIAGLVAAGGDREQVTAAVLVYRALTWGLQIPVAWSATYGGAEASYGSARHGRRLPADHLPSRRGSDHGPIGHVGKRHQAPGPMSAIRVTCCGWCSARCRWRRC